jgi:glycosyltransferase involved in cell wall biosynthesis
LPWKIAALLLTKSRFPSYIVEIGKSHFILACITNKRKIVFLSSLIYPTGKENLGGKNLLSFRHSPSEGPLKADFKCQTLKGKEVQIMKIAQVAPLHESIPPKLYGGTERVVSSLVEELVVRGHDVTLYASGDSLTRARLIPCVEQSLRLNPSGSDILSLQLLQLESVFRDIKSYDIVHFHTEYLHFPLSRRFFSNQVTTLHGRLDLPGTVRLFEEYTDIPVISISHNQRLPLPRANWLGTVYNGIDKTPYILHPEPGCYLAFLGRISPEKGVEQAIEIALRSDVALCIAAKIDDVQKTYYDQNIQKYFDHPLITFLGEISESEKSDFLGNALGLIFPIQWPEPFGLVMIESLACGTPVVAFNRGSVPEIIDDCLTGFIVETIDEAVAAVGKLGGISRQNCRNVFEKRFSSGIMTDGYLDVYNELAGKSQIPDNNDVYP